MLNEYYIIPIGLLKNPILDVIVETADTVRKNLAGTKCIVKTYVGVVDHPALSAHTKLTHAEAVTEMAKPEWTTSI